jgi:hypothetical protein
MDDLDRDLAGLAPSVDTVTARSTFDRRRTRLRRRRQVLAGVASVVMLAAGGLGVVALWDEPSDEVAAGPDLEPTGPVEFEVLAVVQATQPWQMADRARLITDEQLLEGVLGDHDPSATVDFATQLVVTITIPDDACPPELAEFTRQIDVIEPVFVEPAGGCDEPLIHRTYVVVLERSSLGSATRLHVPAQEVYELPEEYLDLPSALAFDVLAQEDDRRPVGGLVAAVDADQLASLWDAFELAGSPPDVDFDERVVVGFTVANGACRWPAGFARAGDVVTLVWADGGCRSMPFTQPTYVVAIERPPLEPRFTLRLAGEVEDGTDLLLDVVLDHDQQAAPPPPDLGFEVLDMREASEPMGSLRSATDAEGFAVLWEGIGFDGEPPSVDFGEEVVVSVTIPDDACPPELTGFARAGDVLTPTFVEPDGGCVDPLIPKTYVVALDRAPLEPGFTLRLPGQDLYRFGEQRAVVRLSGSAAAPGCAAVEAFAEQLVDVGITYDYSATQSPADLLSQVDFVLRGTLTGGFSSAMADDSTGSDHVAYEVAVDEWLFVRPDRDRLPGRQLVSVPFNEAINDPGNHDPAAYADAIAVGAPVVIFAHGTLGNAAGDLVASIEGFITECPGGPLLGWVGGQGEWAAIDTLDELAAAIPR